MVTRLSDGCWHRPGAPQLRAAHAHSRGDRVAEPGITAAALDHLLLCSRELLQNLLIDTTSRPRRIER